MSQDGPLDLSIRALRVLVAVDEAGTMAKPAERLGASPAAVSQQIANREALARTRLLDRSERPIRPTPAGALLLGHASEHPRQRPFRRRNRGDDVTLHPAYSRKVYLVAWRGELGSLPAGVAATLRGYLREEVVPKVAELADGGKALFEVLEDPAEDC